MQKFKYLDNQPRGPLVEGRNYGLAFGFCKHSDGVLETIQPLSPCKDYLNDVVYSEATGKPFSAYGLHTKKTGCFDGGFGYLAMGILPYKHGGLHSKHAVWVESLKSNLTAIKSFLSHFELAIGTHVSTALESSFTWVSEERLVAILPKFWVEATYRISLWTLLMRVALDYKEGDPIGFLEKVSNEDAYLVKSAIPKLKAMMYGTVPAQDFSTLKDVHNCGIVAFKFPETKSP